MIDQSREQYDALPFLNWSKLRLLAKSPQHYQQGWGEETEALRLGTAAHMATLEPEKFAASYVVYSKRRAGKEWEQFSFEATEQGKQVLSAKEHTEALAISHSVRSHPAARRRLSAGSPEVGLTWHLGDKSTGIYFDCKGRADWISSDAIVDLKTTQDASPDGFSRSVIRYGYAGQAAWYSDGYYRSTGKRLPFVIVAVESSAPYVVSVFRVPESVIEIGREIYLSLLEKLHRCQKSNVWHGYTEAEETDLLLPRWYKPEESQNDE